MYRIFLVEDDPIIAETVQKHLESWGWQVKAAADFARVITTATIGAAKSARSPGCR